MADERLDALWANYMRLYIEKAWQFPDTLYWEFEDTVTELLKAQYVPPMYPLEELSSWTAAKADPERLNLEAQPVPIQLVVDYLRRLLDEHTHFQEKAKKREQEREMRRESHEDFWRRTEPLSEESE